MSSIILLLPFAIIIGGEIKGLKKILLKLPQYTKICKYTEPGILTLFVLHGYGIEFTEQLLKFYYNGDLHVNKKPNY